MAARDSLPEVGASYRKTLVSDSKPGLFRLPARELVVEYVLDPRAGDPAVVQLVPEAVGGSAGRSS